MLRRRTLLFAAALALLLWLRPWRWFARGQQPEAAGVGPRPDGGPEPQSLTPAVNTWRPTPSESQWASAPDAAFGVPPGADLDWQSEPAATAADEERLVSSPNLSADSGATGAGDEMERAVGEGRSRPDDLLLIEGIGPKVSTIVTAAGITSFAALAAANVDQLRAILTEGGIETLDPNTWPAQARLADEGRWEELKALQERIHDGRITS